MNNWNANNPFARLSFNRSSFAKDERDIVKLPPLVNSSLDRLPKMSLRQNNNGGLPDFYNNQINLNDVAEDGVPNSGEKLRIDEEGNEMNQNSNVEDSREASFANNRDCFLCRNSANPSLGSERCNYELTISVLCYKK